MAKIVCCGNQKGGCAKTTSVLNIANCMAQKINPETGEPYKVLLVDFDSQGSASLNVGIDVADEEINTIDELLAPVVEDPRHAYDWDVVQNYIYTPTYISTERSADNRMKWTQTNKPFGFDVLPAGLNLSLVELRMAMKNSNNGGTIYAYYLRDLLKFICDHRAYDFVIIDTPPALGALSINAIAAAHEGVIIPTNLDAMSFRGIGSFIESVEAVVNMDPTHRGILGILLSLYSERRSIDKALEEYLHEFLPIQDFSARVPESTDVKKANASNFVFTQINKKAYKAFDSICDEILYGMDHKSLRPESEN